MGVFVCLCMHVFVCVSMDTHTKRLLGALKLEVRHLWLIKRVQGSELRSPSLLSKCSFPPRYLFTGEGDGVRAVRVSRTRLTSSEMVNFMCQLDRAEKCLGILSNKMYK